MKRFWDKSDRGDIDARLRDERPEPPQRLIDRINDEIAPSPTPHAISRTRKGVAIVFASLVLTSGFVAVAFGEAGGNGGGNNGGGNGNSGTPAGCVEGNGNVTTSNPHC